MEYLAENGCRAAEKKQTVLTGTDSIVYKWHLGWIESVMKNKIGNLLKLLAC